MQPRLTKINNLMKKILFAIALVIVLGFGANAQDGFFKSNDGGYENRGSGGSGNSANMALPNHGLTDDQTAPIGSGLLILTALGAGYALRKKRS